MLIENSNVSLLTLLIFLLLYFFSPYTSQGQTRPLGNLDVSTDTIAARQFLEQEKVWVKKGNYQQAVDAVQKAYELYEKQELWEAAIGCALQMSQLADNFSTTAPKVKYSKLALALAQQYLSKNHLSLASAYRQKAEALMFVGLLDSANHFLNKAVPIFRHSQSWSNLGWSEVLLGVNCLNQYQLDSSEVHLKKVALLLQDQVLSEGDEVNLQSTLFNLLGALYELQGDYNKAIDNTEQALALITSKPHYTLMDSSNISVYYNNLGAFHFIKGDYPRALDNFFKAIGSYKNYSLDPKHLNNIGESFNQLKKYPQAVSYFRKSLALTKGQSDNIQNQMNALIGLSTSFKEKENPDSILYYCQLAIDLPTDYRKYIALNILAKTYIDSKQTQRAVKHLNDALELYEKDSIASSDSPYFISKIYRLMGNAYALNNDKTTALNFYQKALIVNHGHFTDSLNLQSNPSLDDIFEPIYFLEAIQAKAKILASFVDQPDQQEAALLTYQLTIQWIDTLQASYASETSQLDWSSTFKPIYEEAIGVAYQCYQHTEDEKYLNLAFTFSEKSKNAILLESLKATEGKSIADVPDSLILKEKDLNLDIAFYEKSLKKAQEQNEVNRAALYQQYLSKSRLELAALREQLERDYPTFHDWKYGGNTTTIARVQSKLLDEQTAFLEYFLGDSTAFVFVITKHSASLLPLISPAQIRYSVVDFRKALLNPDAFRRNAKTAFVDYQQKATLVYQHILKMALVNFPANIQRLIIVPDDVLNAVPFEALCNEKSTEADFDFALLSYLLYDFRMSYAYSADLLIKNYSKRERISSNTDCLAFAPTYKEGKPTTQRSDFKQLRSANGQLEGTANEIEKISHFVKGQFDFGADATERQFKSLADQFGILHLAMHGVIDLDNANFNHLKFSDLAQDSIEDNLLYHYEIANMDLKAQLVVLSACETGLGKYEKGEGVFSLARSFMYAGIPSVVMSLWKVSDESTSQLMPYFYKNLTDGQSKVAALHQAKLRFLKEANVEYRHPFYWSAFVMLGDAQHLKTKDSNKLWWGMGVLVLGLLGWLAWRKVAKI